MDLCQLHSPKQNFFFFFFKPLNTDWANIKNHQELWLSFWKQYIRIAIKSNSGCSLKFYTQLYNLLCFCLNFELNTFYISKQWCLPGQTFGFNLWQDKSIWFKSTQRYRDEFVGSLTDISSSAVSNSVATNWICQRTKPWLLAQQRLTASSQTNIQVYVLKKIFCAQ